MRDPESYPESFDDSFHHPSRKGRRRSESAQLTGLDERAGLTSTGRPKATVGPHGTPPNTARNRGRRA